ncbi:EpsG family protein [Providencia huaxiensis]|uniref:EpsG family protein n=2 Tax=Morganellaceae TaxID=1903414 RepID=UPI0024AC0092
MIYYTLVYMISYLLSILGKNNNIVKILFISLLLALFASLRSPFVDRDYLNYYYLWYIGASEIENIYFEFLSKSIFILSKNLDLEFYFVLFIFSFFSLIFKLMTIRNLNYNLTAFLCIYVGYFYFQHDMTQMRLALALGFFTLSFSINNKKSSILLLVLSLLTHASIIALLFGKLPIFKKRNVLLMMLCITYSAFLLYLLGLDATFLLKSLIDNIPYLNKYLFYFSGQWISQSINVINFTNISFLLITTVISLFIFKYDSDNKTAINICNYTFLGLLFIPLFHSIPVISFRLSQAYLIFFPLLVAYFITMLTNKILLKNSISLFFIKSILSLLLFLYGMILYYIVVIHSEILNPYSTILSESIS